MGGMNATLARSVRVMSLLCVLGLSSEAVVAGTIYVDAGAPPGGDGTEWKTAYNDLQTALEMAQAADEIWVASGTYKPSVTTSGFDPRKVSFQLVDRVTLYGGFAGNEDQVWQRDVEANATILSGDIGIPGDPTDNAYNVVTAADLLPGQNGADMEINGFTITSGTANGGNAASDPDDRGGGMIVFRDREGSSDVRIVRCTFEANYASFRGGGLDVGAGPTRHIEADVVNCTFRHNSTDGDGGGAAHRGKEGGENDTLTMVNCLFHDNNATNRGGGFYNSITNQLLITTRSVVVNCTFSENAADGGAGQGGGVFNEGTFVSHNSIFWGNTATTGTIRDQQITAAHAPQGETTVTYSCIQDAAQGDGDVFPGAGNIDRHPRFQNAAANNFRPRPGSPCNDSGDQNQTPADEFDIDDDGNVMERTPDLDLGVRLDDDPLKPDTGVAPSPMVDMGAYEYSPTGT